MVGVRLILGSTFAGCGYSDLGGGSGGRIGRPWDTLNADEKET
jgi:hypothetical protein